MPTALRLTLAALVVGVLGVCGSMAPPAAAQVAPLDPPGRCPFISTADAAKEARAVFTGVPDTVSKLPKPEDESGAYFLHTVTLTRVYRGSVDTATVEVRTEQTPRECSLGRLELGTEYAFFAVDGDPWVARSGAGTRPADTETVDKLVTLLGEGRAPVPPEPEAAEFTPVATDEPEPLSQAAAPGAVLVLTGLLGLLVARVFSRRARNR